MLVSNAEDTTHGRLAASATCSDRRRRPARQAGGKIDEVRKLAGTIRGHATKIEQQSDDVRTALTRLLTRLLTQAQSALSVAAEVADDAA